MLKRIIDLTLQYRSLVLAGILALMGAGGYALYTIPVEAFPDLTNNQVVVVTDAPSMPPTEVEQLVTYPIERAMLGLPDKEEVRSLSKLGLSMVTIVFDDSVAMYLARQLVSERLQQTASLLPRGAQPVLGLPATAFGELYQYTLSGPMSPLDLKDRALSAHRTAKSGRPSQTYLLTGLTRCGACGAAVCGSYSHGHPYYKCSGVDPVTGKRSCGARSFRLDFIEPAIWSDAVDTLANEAKLAALYNAQFAEAAAKESDHAAERADLADQIDRLKRREFRCRQSMLDADLADSYGAFRHDLRTTIQRRRSLERRLESIAPAQQPVRPENFIEFCSRMERAWGIQDRGQQREFLRACIDQITITREEVSIGFSLNAAAAMAAIGPDPGEGPDAGTNCQPWLGAVGCELPFGHGFLFGAGLLFGGEHPHLASERAGV